MNTGIKCVYFDGRKWKFMPMRDLQKVYENPDQGKTTHEFQFFFPLKYLPFISIFHELLKRPAILVIKGEDENVGYGWPYKIMLRSLN